MNTDIADTVRAALHEAVDKKIRKPRKKSQYSEDLKLIIGKYKDEYRKKTTTEARHELIRSYILVDAFNYWWSKGEVEQDIDEEDLSDRIKNLSIWIRNNWRSYHKTTKLPADRKQSRVDVVWWNMQGKVVETVNDILKEQGVTEEATQTDIFKYRTAAAKRVYLNLTADEQAAILKQIERREDIVPPEVKQKRAQKLAALVVANSARKNWIDMGLYTLTFYGFIKANGLVQLEIHDNMAGYMGSKKRKFVDIHGEHVEGLVRKTIEYIKMLQPSTSNDDLQRPRLDLVISTKDGYPWMPLLEDKIEQKKDELEKLSRQYLNDHYKLASGNQKKHVPFGTLCSKNTEFIDDEYVPADFVWKDPRNMTKDSILELCDHIRQRQDEYGSKEAFRFKAYFDGKNMVKAEYGGRADDMQAAAKAQNQRKTRKEKQLEGVQNANRKGKGKESRPAASHRNAASTPQASTSAAHVPQIDPALLGDGDTTPNPEDTDVAGRQVEENEMQILIANGYPTLLPINGPNDGLPRYYVPAAGIKLLTMIIAKRSEHETNSVEQDIAPGNIGKNQQIHSGRQRKNQTKDKIEPTRWSTRGQKDPNNIPTPAEPLQMKTRSQKKRGNRK